MDRTDRCHRHHFFLHVTQSEAKSLSNVHFRLRSSGYQQRGTPRPYIIHLLLFLKLLKGLIIATIKLFQVVNIPIFICIFVVTKKRYIPKIFEYFGFIFYFYSNEHEPIHVHVMHGARESVFDLIMMDGALVEVRVREKKGAEPLPEKDKRTAEEFIRKYYKNIIDKWVKFFVLKQAIRSTNIKKKI